VQAPEQQRQPPGGNEQFTLLGQGASPADKPGDVAEALFGANPPDDPTKIDNRVQYTVGAAREGA